MKFKPLGILLIFAGLLIIILQPLTTITGAVINPTITIEINFIIGLSVLIFGIILLATGLEELVEVKDYGMTREFKKDIKGVNKSMIKRAIEKIGTGLADEKHRRYGDVHYQIRVDGGGRIFYQVMPNNSIVLTEYRSSSRHIKKK